MLPRSSLRKTLFHTLDLAGTVLEESSVGKGKAFNSLLYSVYKFLGCFHTILPGRVSSLLVYRSAREFWDESMNSISHAGIDELKNALQNALPKQVAAVWLSRLSFQGHAVGEKEFAALTDDLGLIGGIARAANSVPHILSPPACVNIQISSTWDDDLRASSKPVRMALDSVGTVNKYAQADGSGNMVIEMCEHDSASILVDKSQRNSPLLKGLVGHVVLKSEHCVDEIYMRGFEAGDSTEISTPV